MTTCSYWMYRLDIKKERKKTKEQTTFMKQHTVNAQNMPGAVSHQRPKRGNFLG